MGRRTLGWTLAAALALAATGATGCSTNGGGCGGQCGPPFQVQVTFRPGTTTDSALAAMRRCQGEPIVVRVGRVSRRRGFLTATVFTKSMSGSRPIRLLDCLRLSRAVRSAGFPD
jgi:hypothetical protein